MTNLVEEIKTIIQNEANNNPPPQKAEIIKTYPDNHADIQTTDKIVSYVEVIGTNEKGQSGIVCYAEGLVENGVFITNNTTDIDRIYELLGLKIDKTEAYSLLDEKADENHTHDSEDITDFGTAFKSNFDTNLKWKLVYDVPISEFNTTYIDTSKTNGIRFYKCGNLILCRYYLSTKTFSSTAIQNILNSSTLPSYVQASIVFNQGSMNASANGEPCLIIIDNAFKILPYRAIGYVTTGSMMYIAKNTDLE